MSNSPINWRSYVLRNVLHVLQRKKVWKVNMHTMSWFWFSCIVSKKRHAPLALITEFFIDFSQKLLWVLVRSIGRFLKTAQVICETRRGFRVLRGKISNNQLISKWGIFSLIFSLYFFSKQKYFRDGVLDWDEKDHNGQFVKTNCVPLRVSVLFHKPFGLHTSIPFSKKFWRNFPWEKL